MLHENNENLMRFINLDKELSSIYQKQSKKFEITLVYYHQTPGFLFI